MCRVRLWPRVFCCGGCGQTVLVARPGIFSGMQPSDWERLWAFRTRAGSLGGPDRWLSAPPLGQGPRGLSPLPLGKVLVASLSSPWARSSWPLSPPLGQGPRGLSLLSSAVEWGRGSSQARGEELTDTCPASIPGQGRLPLPSDVSNARLLCRQEALETSACSPATVSSSHTTCGHLQCPISCISHTDSERGSAVPPRGCG